MDLLVMACCANKLDQAAPALELYRSRAFNVVRDHQNGRRIRQQPELAVAILSAKHGLIASDEVIAPYDQKMTAARSTQIGLPHKVPQLLEQASSCAVFGGELYRRILRGWCYQLGIELTELVGAGRGCGDHYRALKLYLAHKAVAA